LDLSFRVFEKASTIAFFLDFRTDLFKKETIERFFSYFTNILKEVVLNNNVKLSDINILSAQETELLRNVYNETNVPYQRDTNLVAAFIKQAEQHPDRIAVSDGNRMLTYCELNEHANKVANYLINEGIVHGNMVGLLFERSLDMIVGILGALKAGGIYLPIDPTLPEQRINYMLNQSRAVFLLSQEKYLDPYTTYLPTQAINSPKIVMQSNANVSIDIQPTDLAYCIFTSGSSGRPKGVMVNHRNIINLAKGLEQEVYHSYEDKVLKVALLASFSFDASVQQIYGCLLLGHSLYIADDNSRRDGEKLRRFYEENDIDLSDGTPTHLRLLTDTLSQGVVLGNLSSWILAGEVLPKDLVKEFYGKVGKQVQLYNFYGPTETCVDSTSYKIDIERIDDYPFIPIGKPLPNERIYIADPYGGLVPAGVIGELCIAGDGLAQRYVGDEATTSEKFRNDWISGEERVYRTGDMARWLPDGNLEYRGRIDSQVKLRGYRIELLEIENQLSMHPDVNYCAVDLKGTESEKFLVAYYESSSEIATSELRHFLSHSLPGYMVPSYYMWVSQLPLTNNGKVDRNSLPDYTFRNSGIYIPPSSEIEKKLVAIWADVLKIDAKSISTTNNFFDLGGQSLKLVFLANRIKDAFRISIGLQKLTSLQNIQELAKEISASVAGDNLTIPKINISDFYPLSYAQKQFYLLNQFNNKSTVYNQPQAFFLEGNLEKNRLRSIFQRLIAHHESFRTTFKTFNDSPVQYILDEVTFELEYFESSLERCNEIISKFIRPFDLSIAPLLRACLIRIDEEKHLLIIDMHHIISDGLSLDIFMRDFMLLYQEKELSPAPLEYRNYAVWQQGSVYQQMLEDQKLYWEQVFSVPFTNLVLPTDHERPAILSYHGAKIDFNIDLKHTQLLKDLARSLNATQFSVVLGIFKILLYKLSGQNDIIVGIPVSGRRNTEIEYTIGVFINVLAIRSHIESHDNVFDFLKSLNQNVIQGLEHQDYPSEKLVTDLGIARDVNRNPLYDVMFVYREEEPLNTTTFKTYELDPDTSQMDLILYVNATENGMQLSFRYSKDLFDQASIENFIQYFNQIVDQVILNTPINKINILSVAEQELITKFNNYSDSFEINANIVEIFEKQAYELPDRKAVVYDDVSLSYKELNECSNQLAAYLIDKGVSKGDIVGLLLNRNIDIIIGILGILKSGGAYLPIDHKLPTERISYMLESSNAKLLLGHMEHLEIFRDQIDIHDINSFDIKSFESSNLLIERHPSDLVYCIFTSGSTGAPKGVLMEDRSIVNLVIGLNSTVYENLDSALRVGLIASYSFDVSCQQIYSALLNAHTLFISNENERTDGEELYNFYKRHGIQVSDSTPTHFGMFLRNLKGGIHLPELKAWLFAGEVLPKELVLEFYEYPDVQHIALYNMYGPTETCVVSTSYKIDPLKLEQFKTIPIGWALPNERIYIVDEFGNSVPKGVVGELCIAGTGLARGYIGNTSDNDKFVKNWIKGEERVYKSGDLGHWLPDGNIIYKRRIDNQIKLRGYRIELGEIEQVLLSHVAVLESVVSLVNIDGENYLTAYYISSELLNDEQLRDYLTLRLPEYMVPSFYVQLDTMPLTSNGKLNRNALPIPNRADINLFVGASTETEKRLINIWAEVLNMHPQSISINQSFLQLGGNSLSAMQIANKIKREFKIELKLVNLFQKVTILQQGSYIDATLWIRTEDQLQETDNQEINI
jgi:amino acid adenylation domain-containing protein